MGEQQAVVGQEARSAWQVTSAIWRALFLREASSRLSAGRAAWLWMLLAPIAQVALLMLLFSTLRDRSVPGVEFALFLAVGVLGFHMFKNGVSRSISAIEANQSLFTYRQFRAADAVIVRCFLEGVLYLVVIAILLTGAEIFGFDAVPVDPLGLLLGFFLLWFLGFGLGMMASVGARLIPEIGKVVTLVLGPLYFVSGVFFRPEMAPPAVREWLLLNPVVHGVEGLRSAMFPAYHPLPEISFGYLAICGLVTTFLGFLLHVRFAQSLAAR